MSEKHSPLPWRATPKPDERVDEFYVRDAMNDPVAVELFEADAQYIVRAANAFPKLVEALEKAVYELNTIRARDGVPYTHNGWKSDVCPDYFSTVVDQCFAALSLAKGEPHVS